MEAAIIAFFLLAENVDGCPGRGWRALSANESA
jgi:hypothetical protein